MPLDAICLSAVREELSGRIVGMRIEKIQQPERDVILLTLRGGTDNCRLLISAGVGDARVHLTDYRFENPASPPMFCMLLRKHLVGAKITSVSQIPAERVLELGVQAPDPMGTLTEKRIIVELIGRISNIILTDTERIIDCLRRIGGDLSDKRAVLPGMLYRPPQAQEGKRDPFPVSEAEWRDAFHAAVEKTADKWLLSSFTAFSPLICRELVWRAYGETDKRIADITDGGAALESAFFTLIENARSEKFEPWVIADGDGSPSDFSFTRIEQYEGALKLEQQESFSAMLEGFYTQTAQRNRGRQRAAVMLKTITTARDRLARKLALQHEELKKASDRETLRECGDIIAANYHLLEKGMDALTAQDFYRDDGSARTIALDAKKTPQQNAARYYKEYSKAKNAEKFLLEQIEQGNGELLYLESVIHEIGQAESERDLSDIRSELEQTGYVKAGRKGGEKVRGKARDKVLGKARDNSAVKRRGNAGSAPMRFVSSSGLQIRAGRNNMQNDALTMKTALKSDIWLHAQKINGSHVIISCNGGEPDEASLSEAAAIAAYHSSAQSGGKTAVDYTQVRNVKKPSGARPGMVVYTNYKTIIASPDEQLVQKLRTGSAG